MLAARMDSGTLPSDRPAFEPDLAAGRPGLPRLWRRQGSWQIRMRWAVAPLMIAGLVAGRLLGFELPLVPIALIALVNLAYNALFALVFRRHRDRLRADPGLDRRFTTVEVLVDYAAMFLLIYFTGGASSPLAVFLVFHVIITAIQLTTATAYALAGVAAGGLWVLLLGEAGGWLHSHPIAYRGTPLFPQQPAAGAVTLVVLTATLFIAAGVVGRIADRLRARVGDLAEASSDLARAYEEVQALMDERTEFMLEAAHNLRAPLTASLSIVDLLTAGYLGDMNERQTEKLHRLEDRLRPLDDTIGELLAIARARDRSREIEDVVADFEALARHTEETFAAEAAARGLDFRVVRDGGLPPLASGRGLLEQLMENLVSNAIKYTPEGGRVEVRFGHDPDSIRITVADTGIGIPEDEQGKLFREFFRATNARRLTPLGTGLGLVLARQTVDRHGGTLELTSAEGEGTTVVVTLPKVRPF